MNNTYSIFKRNNPNFKGNVSLVAHSLGSVIAYDVLTNWSPLLLYDQFVTTSIVSVSRSAIKIDVIVFLERTFETKWT